VAVSALWVLGVGIVAPNFNTPLIPPQAFVMKDATSGFFKLDNYFDRFDASFKAAHRDIQFPNNVSLFVVNTVPDTTVEAKASEFYKTYSETRAGELWSARLNFWGGALLVALIPPLVLLGLGVVMAWIFAGFARGADL
jgi:hypothetical protein